MRAAEIHPGDVIAGKYRVRTILARSPTLQLEAFHVEFDQRVVIKLLLPGTGDDKEIERFKREARTLAKLETEHATRIIDVGSEDDGSFYLVRQYVEGEELGQYIATYGPRPLPEAVLLVLQAAEAAAEAHSHGIVLREISPASMTVTRRPGGMPSIKITDFGTAKLMRDSAAPTGSSSLTATALFGLSPYSSPELVRKAKSVDGRADVWSLGAVFYALLVGRPPFDGDMATLMLAITREDPRPVTEARRDVPPEIDQIIAWALAKDLDGRFKNVYALAHALRPFAPQEGHVLIDRIAQITEQRKAKGGAASVPPPPVIAAAGHNPSKTLPLSAFGPGGVAAALARSKAADLEEEFGGMSGAEDAATVALGGDPPPRAARSVGSIPPPPPSRPPSPWVPGTERARYESAAVPAAPASQPGAYEQRYNTIPPPPAAPSNGSALAGQALSQRAPEPKRGFDKRILWGAVASMAVMLPVFLLLLLRGGPRDPQQPTQTPLAQQPVQQQPGQPTPQAPTPSPQPPAGNAVVLNADAAKAPTPQPPAAIPEANAKPQAPATHPAAPTPATPTPAPAPAKAEPPKEEPASSGGGTLLAIASGGSCNFSVDGGGRGSGSSLRVSLPAGKHSVTCSPSSGSPKSRGVTIKSGETSMLTFKL